MGKPVEEKNRHASLIIALTIINDNLTKTRNIFVQGVPEKLYLYS